MNERPTTFDTFCKVELKKLLLKEIMNRFHTDVHTEISDAKNNKRVSG